MKTLKFSHIGVAVKNLDEAIKLYTEVLGVDPKNVKVGGRPDFMRIANIMIGDERNHALQHIGVYVDDVGKALEEFRAKGARMLDEKPRQMPDGHKIGFIIPRNTEMLIELMEK
jgi:methylmalonyl-CoA/ethylmalonyl-CoA epimerase